MMPKIAYNACFGGFGLSHKATMRYAELKGITLYPEVDPRFRGRIVTYWTVPESERGCVLTDEAFYKAPSEARQASNDFYRKHTISSHDLERDDPVLTQVIEEMGDAANGDHAKLRIAEIPTGSRYRIDEYDGFESVETPDSYEWKTA